MRIPLGFGIQLWLLRLKINDIDDEIYKLICRRMEYAKYTNHYKTSIFDKRREEEVLTRLKKKGVMKDEMVEDLWKPLMKHCRMSQEE